ncbi:hypothetical protein [Dyadobacter diqingensis]|uniref:hypothetical protein n=1 Tax=Dyadobacter diqingensis TaxID=2938121 RepID=UPI0020C2ED3C|nr:hypothetical protein [Dyadobacter diqingensis]
MNKLYLNSILPRKREGVSFWSIMIFLMVSCLSYGQQGSQGNTTVFNGAQATLFGAHTFVTGGTGTQPGIIKTIRTAPFGIVSFGPAATYSGAADASHVDGYVGKYGTTAFTFPIGNATKLRPVSISAPASGNFKAAYWFSNPNDAALPAGAPFLVANLGTGVTAVSNVEYWDVDGPSAVNLTLSWDAASNLSALTASTLTNLVVVGYNPATSKWENLGKAGGTTGTLAGTGTITANGVTPDTYSAFTFGVANIGTPDLTPIIESTTDILAVGALSDLTVYIENIKPYPTSVPVVVTITKPTASSGLTLVVNPSADWTLTQTSTSYIITLVGIMGASDSQTFTARVTRTGGSAGSYNFSPVIANSAGGETNNANNRASVVIIKR